MPRAMLRLLLFAKRPRSGRVKTRLAGAIGAGAALRLYRAFLSDQIDFLRSFEGDCEIELWIDGAWRPLPGDPSVEGLRLRPQGAGDLGQRMLRAFQRAWSEGAGATVVIPADAPTLPASRVRQAFETLEASTPAVVVPASDGGYVLLGLQRPFAELFRDVAWGGPEVLQATIERAASCGIVLAALEPWYDVDGPADLERLRADLSRPELSHRAPRTLEALQSLDAPAGPVV